MTPVKEAGVTTFIGTSLSRRLRIVYPSVPSAVLLNQSPRSPCTAPTPDCPTAPSISSESIENPHLLGGRKLFTDFKASIFDVTDLSYLVCRVETPVETFAQLRHKLLIFRVEAGAGIEPAIQSPNQGVSVCDRGGPGQARRANDRERIDGLGKEKVGWN
jgi:hypothetical protein